MSDDRKFDLSAELSQAKSAFLNDVETAAEEVKQQLKAAAEDEKKKEQIARSKRLTAMLVAVGAVLVILVSYWLVFARPGNNASGQPSPTASGGTPVQIVSPPAPAQPAVPSAPRTARPGRTHADSQVVEHPSDEYEQPGDDSGM
jgi:hypothetical protein